MLMQVHIKLHEKYIMTNLRQPNTIFLIRLQYEHTKRNITQEVGIKMPINRESSITIHTLI